MNNAEEASRHLRQNHTRAPIVAGLFYPASAKELDSRIIGLLDNVDAQSSHCSAIISPHGSLDYSGSIAARAWKSAAAREIGTIIIISPSHRSFDQGILLPQLHSFSLPNGEFQIDRALVRELIHCSTEFHANDIPHFEEHSIEMQLIFAARLFPSALIIPVIVSNSEGKTLDSLLANLQFFLGDRIASTLFVLTSNLAVDTNPDICLNKSARILEAIEQKDLETLGAISEDSFSFCGGRIIGAYLRSSLSSGTEARILGMGSSAALIEPGDPVVGYGAVGFSR
ncbi:MAG: AmmeMemoRadiSam system protein B [Spirochaetia bacterium]|jgi:AmmeMemoRadiSam system protein B|nr:AmmeMemoRadiSam system protein B [Spirochaetia bacterium]